MSSSKNDSKISLLSETSNKDFSNYQNGSHSPSSENSTTVSTRRLLSSKINGSLSISQESDSNSNDGKIPPRDIRTNTRKEVKIHQNVKLILILNLILD